MARALNEAESTKKRLQVENQDSTGEPELICEDSLTNPPGMGGQGTNTQPNLQNTINFAMRTLGYTPGIFYAAACQTCRPGNPCDFSDSVAITNGAVVAGFATELNTHYDESCVTYQINQPTDCTKNEDLGVTAFAAFEAAIGEDAILLTNFLHSILKSQNPLCANPQVAPLCWNWERTTATVYVQNEMDSQRQNFIITTDAPSPVPTPHPVDPTPEPTRAPTVLKKCFKYTNRVIDHQFIGVAEDCRKGIDDRWPGGKTCKSPYVICLPAENTPANPDSSEVPNFGQTLPATDYSIQECAEECAFDQRCLGFELRPTSGAARGECMLIDDIPVELNLEGTWPTGVTPNMKKSGLAVATPIANGNCCPDATPTPASSLENCKDIALGDMEANFYSFSALGGGFCVKCRECPVQTDAALWVSGEITGRLMLGSPANFGAAAKPALCFAKMDYCNPFFEAADLNAEMLECYCPNNRKGTYTKKVKRTVPNTRYCGADPTGEIGERIRKAQANRMFHLCENWCLFETHNPQTESWYWNPWHTCWREQYAGIGTHRSYCNRVIRDPMTIEQQFINHRSDNFCKKNPISGDVEQIITEEPTGSPVTFSSTWYVADEEDSCDDACNSRGLKCDELTTASLITGSDSDIQSAYSEATGGGSCSKIET